MNKKLSLAALAVTGVIFSSASFAAGFDCNKASGYVEQTICSTPALSALDDKVSGLYGQAIKQNPDNKAAIRKSQLAWLKEVRNKSTSFTELQNAYVNRVNDLNAIVGGSAQAAAVSGSQPQSAVPAAVAPVPQAAPVAQSAAPVASAGQASVERSCQVQVTYSKDAVDQYITNQKTQPNRLRVTDNGDSFIIHFERFYGLGDMNSEFISPRGKEFMNVKQEQDGTTSFYRKSEANGFLSFIFTSVKGSMKPRFDASLYDCRTGVAASASQQQPAVNAQPGAAPAAAAGEVKTYHLTATSAVLDPIEMDFRSSSALDMKVYNNAKNYADGSDDRYRMLSIYRDYGVSVADFDNIVIPQCRAETDSLTNESKAVQSQWGTFSSDPSTRERQQKERWEYLQQWTKRFQAATDRMQQCWSEAALRVPEHTPR